MNQTRVIFDRNGRVCRPNSKESARLPECGVFDRPFVPQNRGDAPVKPATGKPKVTGEITPPTSQPSNNTTTTIQPPVTTTGRPPRGEVLKASKDEFDEVAPGQSTNRSIGRRLTDQLGINSSDPSIRFARAAVGTIFGDTRRREDEQTGISKPYLPELKPKIAEVPYEVMLKARMVEASHRAYRTDFDAAQEYLDENFQGRDSKIRGWTIDRELSTKESLVLTQGDRVKIAYRGTELPNVQDIVTDAAGVIGQEERVPQMRKFRTQIEQVRSKYGVSSITELLGYSKGALPCVTYGNEFNIRSTSFNSYVSAKTLKTKNTKGPIHEMYRTTEDPVSTLLAFRRKGSSNIRVTAVNGFAGHGSPEAQHRLSNFTENRPRASGQIEESTLSMHFKAQELAELETYQAMAEGVREGRGFTETLAKFNQTQGAQQNVDVMEDGSLGSRIHRAAGTVQYWEAAGGEFTPSENLHLNNAVIPQERTYATEEERMINSQIGRRLPPERITQLNRMNTGQLSDHVDSQRAQFQESLITTNELISPRTRMIQNAMPKFSSAATGVAGFLAAHEIMQMIDPNHAIPEVPAEAIEGATAGAIGAGLMTSLGASVALAPEMVAGGVGYVVGAATSRAVHGFMTDHGFSETIAGGTSALVGGATGGVAASVSGMATAFALFGTSLGPAGILRVLQGEPSWEPR